MEHYKVGDAVARWSESQQVWIPDEITGIQKDGPNDTANEKDVFAFEGKRGVKRKYIRFPAVGEFGHGVVEQDDPAKSARSAADAAAMPPPARATQGVADAAAMPSPQQCLLGDDAGKRAFTTFVQQEAANVEKQSHVDAGMSLGEVLKLKFAANVPQLKQTYTEMKRKIPFAKEGTASGVCYMAFQSRPVRAKQGTVHVTFMNPFEDKSYPAGIYFADVLLCLDDVLENGFNASISVSELTHTGVTSYPDAPQGSLTLGADGAYVSGVRHFAVSLLALIATLPGAPPMPVSLANDLATIRGEHQRHINQESRCAFILKETALASSLNRTLDPFIMVATLQTNGTLELPQIERVI
jgi:hypothetical protein